MDVVPALRRALCAGAIASLAVAAILPGPDNESPATAAYVTIVLLLIVGAFESWLERSARLRRVCTVFCERIGKRRTVSYRVVLSFFAMTALVIAAAMGPTQSEDAVQAAFILLVVLTTVSVLEIRALP